MNSAPYTDVLTHKPGWPAFVAVCHNEKFTDYRDFEEELGVAARAVLNDDPSLQFAEIMQWPPSAQQRAGYLLNFLYCWADDVVYRARFKFTEELHEQMKDKMNAVPFFHKDSPSGSDDIAKLWGLTRGVDVCRLRKLVEPPYMT